jgi:hypothetical protein
VLFLGLKICKNLEFSLRSELVNEAPDSWLLEYNLYPEFERSVLFVLASNGPPSLTLL